MPGYATCRVAADSLRFAEVETPKGTSKFCVICGYDLSHAPEDRCSECGTRFSSDDGTTFATSPALLHRLVRHTPRIRAWITDHFGTVNCRCCGCLLKSTGAARCLRCNSWYDTGDLTTVTRSLSVIPPSLLRFQHICLFRGGLAPAAALSFGLYCLVTRSAVLPGISRYGFVHLSGPPALAMGVGWIGLALALHAHYFWGRVEPFWRYSLIPTALGIVLMLSGWGYALLWSVARTLGP